MAIFDQYAGEVNQMAKHRKPAGDVNKAIDREMIKQGTKKPAAAAAAAVGKKPEGIEGLLAEMQGLGKAGLAGLSDMTKAGRGGLSAVEGAMQSGISDSNDIIQILTGQKLGNRPTFSGTAVEAAEKAEAKMAADREADINLLKELFGKKKA